MDDDIGAGMATAQSTTARMRVPAFGDARLLSADNRLGAPGYSASEVSGELARHDRGSPRRHELEEFVRLAYRKFFDAHVTEFMPALLAQHDPTGRIRAVVGYREAADERLFLENYTAKPIEAVIAERLGVTVPRARIVEIGSLACRDGRDATSMVRALVPHLMAAGFSWVVFTCADTVRNVLRRLALEPHVLCPANGTALGPAMHAWGSYYDHHPVVMAGRLLDGAEALDAKLRVQ